MTVTSELRGESYRDAAWVDRHGWVWEWNETFQKWSGRDQRGGPVCLATDDEISNYSLFNGRGPFLKPALD